MKLPKTLKIGGFVWQVEFNKDVSYEGNCWGSTHTDSQKIFIQPDIPKQKIAQTLLHEILHACVSSAGATKALYKDSEEEELHIKLLSGLLYQALKDNNLRF